MIQNYHSMVASHDVFAPISPQEYDAALAAQEAGLRQRLALEQRDENRLVVERRGGLVKTVIFSAGSLVAWPLLGAAAVFAIDTDRANGALANVRTQKRQDAGTLQAIVGERMRIRGQAPQFIR
jgi:hypothetical protein